MDFSALVVFGVLLVRVGMMVATAPIFGSTWAPPTVKAGLTAIFAVLLLPLVRLPEIVTPASLALVVVHEALVGIAIGFSIRIVIGAAELGGYLAGFQLGFAYAGIVDPQSGVRNNVLAVLYGMLALLALLGANVHHALIRLLLASYEAVPVAAFARADGSLAESVARTFGLIVTVGMQLAVPVVLVLLLVEFVLGLMTRAAPSLNLMVIGAPLRLLVGLVTLAAGVQVVPGLIVRTSDWAMELGSHLAGAFR
ncbi:MAG TPA: flagellar biosynthetic protein FliR [Vicinamibacterales bacterium]